MKLKPVEPNRRLVLGFLSKLLGLNIKFDELNHIFTKNANFCYNYSTENVNYGSAELMFYLLFRNFISKQCKESANHATLVTLKFG